MATIPTSHQWDGEPSLLAGVFAGDENMMLILMVMMTLMMMTMMTIVKAFLQVLDMMMIQNADHDDDMFMMEKMMISAHD